MIKSSKPATDIFEEKVLDGRRARLAFPLVRLLKPSISIDEWIDFARRWSRLSLQQGGIMTINDRRGYLHAVFTYRIDQNLRLGRFLRIADIIVGHLPGKALNRAIIDAADRIAARMGCSAIVIEPTQIEPKTHVLADVYTRPFGFLRSQENGGTTNRH